MIKVNPAFNSPSLFVLYVGARQAVTAMKQWSSEATAVKQWSEGGAWSDGDATQQVNRAFNSPFFCAVRRSEAGTDSSETLERGAVAVEHGSSGATAVEQRQWRKGAVERRREQER